MASTEKKDTATEAGEANKPDVKAKATGKKAPVKKAVGKAGAKKAPAKATPKKAPIKPKAKVPKPAKGPRLKAKYETDIRPSLKNILDLKNDLEVPRLAKIVINMGLGQAKDDANMLKGALADLETIAGQKALVTYAKKPISNFKIRQNDPVGAKVTLRKDRMWEFFDRLMSLALPRVRDFRGLPNRSFDGRGNYSFGVTEQIIFPEIDYDKIDQIRGMDITFVTTANTDEAAYALLAEFGFPFRQKAPIEAVS
jgi:large subunit ribosomal protein L5